MFRLPQPAAPVPGKADPAAQHEDELRPDREEDSLGLICSAQPQLRPRGWSRHQEHRHLPLLWAELHEEQTTDEPRLSDEANREIGVPQSSQFDFSIKMIFHLSLSLSLRHNKYDNKCTYTVYITAQ